MEETVKQLTDAFANFNTDIVKTKAGNKAAGTRARKALQEIAVAAKILRKQISGLKNS